MYLSKSNLAYATVAIAPSPALSGTSLTLASGLGSLFPAANFTITVYPPINPLVPVNPLKSNAEICLCTSRTGDVLTIVRAQEGTTAKSIATGWQVANTATALNFTEIENSIIQRISAGSTFASASEVVFSNANGVSFGASGQTITASIATNTQSTQPVAASASNGSFAFATLGFSNANGITFGTSAGSQITASHNGLTSQSNQAASASNGSFAFQTLGFSNANGVTFGSSAGSIITASVAAGAAPGSIAAGGSTLGLGQVEFSNANGISFSLAGSTITASHNGLTSQSAQAASASNGSFAFQTLAFSNANNVTFGTSAGSIITASVAPGGGSINFSAGTTSGNLASIVFSDANNVSFGLNGGTITASASAATGGGANGMQFQFVPALLGNNTNNAAVQFSTAFFDGVTLNSPLSFNVVRKLVSYQGAMQSSNVSITGNATWSQSFAMYSRSVTDSAATNFSASSLWALMFSTVQTTQCFFSASGSSQSLSYRFATNSTGGSSAISTSANQAAALSMSILMGTKFDNIYYNTSLPSGEYLAFLNFSSASAGVSQVASNLLYQTHMFMTCGGALGNGSAFDATANVTVPVLAGCGYYATSLTSVPASLANSDIANNNARRYMIFSRS